MVEAQLVAARSRYNYDSGLDNIGLMKVLHRVYTLAMSVQDSIISPLPMCTDRVVQEEGSTDKWTYAPDVYLRQRQ